MGRLQKDNIPVHSVMLNWAGLNCVLDGMMLNRMVLDRMMGGAMVRLHLRAWARLSSHAGQGWQIILGSPGR